MIDHCAAARPLLAGRYRLGHLVGRGGMADVYAAEDESTGARVAIKVFRDPLAPGAEGEVRHGEVRALEGLRHPGLVELLDVGEDDGRPFVVMTLVDGPTLAERLSQRALSREVVARIGSDLAAALAYVHDRDMVHRDIKPANVLLAADGRARLADFGIARLVDATRVTRSGFTIGTAGYMAPEQVTGERITPAADVYALGLVLLECLTGRREYDGPVIEAALARLHRRPQIPEDLPAGWRSFLQALTADDPAERPTAAITASAAGFLAEQPAAPLAALRLDRHVREPGPSVVIAQEPSAPSAAAATGKQGAAEGDRPAPAGRSVPSLSRGRRGLLLGAAGVIALTGSGAAVLLERQQDQTPVAGAGGTPVSAQTSSGRLSSGALPSSAASEASPAAATSSASPTPTTSPQQALAAVTAELQGLRAADPAAAGPAAAALLERLREVRGLKGPAQANTAVALSHDVRQSIDRGRFEPALGARIETALDRVAAPPDLVGLVRLARQDPEAVGVLGTDLARRLTTLDHDTATDDVPQTAQRLLDTVQQGAVTGRVSPAFARIAVPVLEPLARVEPLDALRGLVDELDEETQAGGEVGAEFLERLHELLAQTVYQRTLQSRALIRHLHDAADQGEVTLAFQARAVPVLEQLAQRGNNTPSGWGVSP